MTITLEKSNVVYCHGVPGSPAEIASLIPDTCPMPYGLDPLDFERFNELVLESDHGLVHVVGFSLGAMTALKIAALYPEKIRKLTLISPAAPLELGDFLPKMAGRLVFKVAAMGSTLFKLLTSFQRIGLSLFPDKLLEAMFSGSPKSDMELLAKEDFKRSIISGLKSSFGQKYGSYSASVLEYVRPWSKELSNIRCPVTIYHGTHDNWAPIEMAYALEESMNGISNIVVFEKLGHYSTLHKALPIILKQ